MAKSTRIWFALKLVDFKNNCFDTKWDNNNNCNYEVVPEKLPQICFSKPQQNATVTVPISPPSTTHTPPFPDAKLPSITHELISPKPQYAAVSALLPSPNNPYVSSASPPLPQSPPPYNSGINASPPTTPPRGQFPALSLPAQNAPSSSPNTYCYTPASSQQISPRPKQQPQPPQQPQQQYQPQQHHHQLPQNQHHLYLQQVQPYQQQQPQQQAQQFAQFSSYSHHQQQLYAQQLTQQYAQQWNQQLQQQLQQQQQQQNKQQFVKQQQKYSNQQFANQQYQQQYYQQHDTRSVPTRQQSSSATSTSTTTSSSSQHSYTHSQQTTSSSSQQKIFINTSWKYDEFLRECFPDHSISSMMKGYRRIYDEYVLQN
jgi:hypothetical protein